MKSFGVAALAVAVFIVALSIFGGLLAVLSLTLGGPETAAGKAAAWGALTLGPLAAGLVTVLLCGRMAKDMSGNAIWACFAIAVVVVASFFTAPYYLAESGIIKGTPETLQAVVLSVVLAVAGGFLGGRWVEKSRAAQAAHATDRVGDTPA